MPSSLEIDELKHTLTQFHLVLPLTQQLDSMAKLVGRHAHVNMSLVGMTVLKRFVEAFCESALLR